MLPLLNNVGLTNSLVHVRLGECSRVNKPGCGRLVGPHIEFPGRWLSVWGTLFPSSFNRKVVASGAGCSAPSINMNTCGLVPGSSTNPLAGVMCEDNWNAWLSLLNSIVARRKGHVGCRQNPRRLLTISADLGRTRGWKRKVQPVGVLHAAIHAAPAHSRGTVCPSLSTMRRDYFRFRDRRFFFYGKRPYENDFSALKRSRQFYGVRARTP